MARILTPDLCVIGAGASGVAVAMAARRLGASVVVVDRAAPGSPAAKSGPVALAALAAAAERANLARSGPQFGVFAEIPRISFRKVHDHIAEVIAQHAPESGPAKLTALGIEIVTGSAAFIDPKTLRAGETDIAARRFVIATGAHPIVPEIAGLQSIPYFTTETIFDNTRKLTHLVIVGAGPMGLEVALSYRRLGSEVTLVEPARVLPHADPELAEIALRRLREEGVTVLEDASVVAILARTQGIGVTVEAGGEMLALDVSHILVASRRVANLGELNLEAGKVRRSKSDPEALALSASLRSSNPKVFAVGEAAGHPPTSHSAALDADLVVRAALLGQPVRYEPAAVPRFTFTDPPIAEIGLTEPMARGRFKNGFAVLRAGYGENDLARARRDGMGVVKLIVARSGRILGAGICGAGAGELASLFALAIEQRIDVGQLGDLAAAHPSFAELARTLGAQALTTRVTSRWQARLFSLSRLLP